MLTVCSCDYRMEILVKLKSSSAQLSMMSQIVTQLKKEKDQASKQVKDIENSLSATIKQIRVSLTMLYVCDADERSSFTEME